MRFGEEKKQKAIVLNMSFRLSAKRGFSWRGMERKKEMDKAE